MKDVFTLLTLFIVIFSNHCLFGQVQLNTGILVQIDFAEFTGAGFDPIPTSGQLNSDEWRIEGLSDGDLTFGGTGTTGDYARGTSSGGETTGGCYSFDYGTGDASFGIQPTGTDFTSGEITLRLQNMTGATLNQLNIQYDVFVYNDQDRANSFNFSYSDDDVSYIDIPGLDYTSVEVGDAIPTWVSVTRATSIIGLSISDGGLIYLRWTGDDVSGSGSRDEFALDNILISEGDTPLPVELTSFTALAGHEQVELLWSTASETDNLGYAIMRSFDEEGEYDDIDSYEYNKNLKGAGNSSTTKNYKFVDNTVINGITYWYKLVDVDFNGIRTEHGPIFAMPHADDIKIDPIQASMPEEFELVQNFPNPFNPSTTINFNIPELEGGLIDVNIVVYDILGQKVKTLLESPLTAGSYQVEWDGTNDQNQVVPSGIYVYQFQSTLFNASKKMVLMR